MKAKNAPKAKSAPKQNRGIAFNTREAATVLAAMRLFQERLDADPDSVSGMDQFYDEKPLSSEQIDALCERINFGETK